MVEQAKFVKTLRILSLRLRFEGEDKSGTRGTAGPSLGAKAKASAAAPPPKAPPLRREEVVAKEEYEEVEEEQESEGESEYSYESSEHQAVAETRQAAVEQKLDRKPVTHRRSSGSADVEEGKKRKH